MKRNQSGGTKNQLSPKLYRPRFNKALLVINSLLCLAAIFLCAANLYHKQHITAVGMMIVIVLTAANAVAAWSRLKGKQR